MIHAHAKGNIFPEPINTGDTATFELLFSTFYADYVYHSFRIVQDLPEAYDIVSEKFKKLWELKMEFGNVEKFKSYLFVSVKNQSLDLLRTRKRDDGQRSALLEITDTSTEAIEREMIRGEVRASVNQLLNKLSPKRREVMEKLFVHGLSIPEAAAILGMKEQTVRNHRNDAIKILKRDCKNIELLLPLLLLICRN